MEEPTVVPAVRASSLRYWYGASIPDFVFANVDAVVGELVRNSSFAVLPTQRDAWLGQIGFLQSQLTGLSGSIFFEFSIPRMGRRIDVVLVVGAVVFAIEFKVGEKTLDRAAIDQVWDYALDLKNFHEASHHAAIVPIALATEATASASLTLLSDGDQVYRPVVATRGDFRGIVDEALRKVTGGEIDSQVWSRAPYHPTPTIVEAACTLYAQHSVEAIARFDAGAKNLHVTSRRIEELVDDARAKRRKRICFVTGVPGAGKTLVGLNLATRRRDADAPTHAVFLSGNGPLVAVLREALTRDEFARQKKNGKKVRKGEVGESVKAFIQNVHHFRDDALIDVGPPIEHVVIFDEAQRAWNLRQTANFMQRKKNSAGFSQSEPEFLISYMDRHKDWAVIVCLVGGGQEINTGEAGIAAWLEAVNRRFGHWEMFISSRLTDSEYAARSTIHVVQDGAAATHFDDSLHLAVSMRSFRAENVSAFVKALLDCDVAEAKRKFAEVAPRFPIVVTRDLDAARRWIQTKARGTERFGLMASSKAMRLKPHAIDIRVSVDPVHYFLNDRDDTRSSYYLEDAATEFQVQGLELDWTCVTWDGDFRFNGSGWDCRDFRGSRWCNIKNEENRAYLKNAYRVLLTRARQGMVLFIPRGSRDDPTRACELYDPTYEYVRALGVPAIGTL
jgi:hypothetical protein